ncbi:MAG: inorganic phosphate transporter [Anaerolineales bacterium]|nr:inorganic phosphate transporter [Anaerolineales bacterium]
MLIYLIAAALVFDFTNGFHDASNIIATVISSRALAPRTALYITAAAEFVAPFIFGVAVATTIGKGLIDPNVISINVVMAGVLAAIIWNLFTWWISIPSSSSHALIGGLLGAAIIASGIQVVQLKGLLLVLTALFVSPPLGLLVSFIFMNIALFVFQNATQKVNTMFRRIQILTSLSLALSHGTNDAQKTMGIITLGLVASGYQETFYVPLWVVTISAAAIALGAASGGWRLIRTLGGRIYKIRPIHAFTSQAASAGVVLGAALIGGPVSTTQVVSGAIMGAGAAERINMVRWQIAKHMLVTWLLTIPASAALSAIIYLFIQGL